VVAPRLPLARSLGTWVWVVVSLDRRFVKCGAKHHVFSRPRCGMRLTMADTWWYGLGLWLNRLVTWAPYMSRC